MEGLKVICVRLPGRWADGWLYKEHLILWSRAGQMFVLSIGELSKIIHQLVSPGLAIAADHAIFRNDWKASEQFRRLRAVRGFTELFDREFSGPEGRVRITVDEVSPVAVANEAVPGLILDASLYANHVYLGSTEGLFESRFDPDRPEAAQPVVRRLDGRMNTVNVKYSAINVSANDNGLLFGQVNFADDNWWKQPVYFLPTAERSCDNSFASFHVLNYAGDAFPTFLMAETKRGRAQDQESRILGYRPPAEISEIVTTAIKPAITEPAEAEVIGNSENRLLVRSGDSLHVVGISVNRSQAIAARLDRRYCAGTGPDPLPSTVLRTHAIGSGFLVALSDEIRLITPHGSYCLASERAARIRTFTRARRHQDTALVVSEDGVSLYGFLEPGAAQMSEAA